MTEDQRILLDRRLKTAIEQQPEIEPLRVLLISLGGIELVAPPTFDPDVPSLIASGSLMQGSIVCEVMEDSACHENVAQLWIEKRDGIIGVGTGYALSEDGLWRQHSWGVRQTEIVETTTERLKYFGKVLQGPDADSFANNNKGDPQRHYWRDLPEVYFRLQKDEDGYPPKDWEGLKSERTDEENVYRIKSIPFFTKDVAYDDEVRTGTSEEGFCPVFESVQKRSGHSTIRLLIEQAEDRVALTEYFTSRGCLLEFNGRLVAIGIPESAFDQISDYIGEGKDRGRWAAEDGYLVIDAGRSK